MEQDKNQELIDLVWRYAVIIGITGPEGIVTQEQRETDIKRWPHLVKKSDDGVPIFDDDDAIRFMAEMSGASIEDCGEVLTREWLIPEGLIEG